MQTVPPLHLLQTLVVFSEQENLVQTAERLGLTQPTVSRQLQQLEELFPQSLFKLQGRNKILTDYGMALVAELKPRFTDFERIFQKVDQNFSNPKQITLRIGGRKELLEKFLLPVPFEGTLEFLPLSGQLVAEKFKEQALDIAVTQAELNSSELIAKKILTDIPALAVPKKWASEISNAKDWSEVCHKHPASAYSRERPFLKEFEEKYKIQTHINCYFDDWTSLEKRVHEGKSWSIIPPGYLSEGRGYILIPLAGLFESQVFFLYYRKELAKFSWMKALIASVASTKI